MCERHLRSAAPILLVLLLFCNLRAQTLGQKAKKDQSPADHSLIEASSKCDAAGIKKALDDGADVNTQTPNGGTPLMYAVISGKKDCVRLLLDRGADPNIETRDKETAKDFARENPAILDMLLTASTLREIDSWGPPETVGSGATPPPKPVSPKASLEKAFEKLKKDLERIDKNSDSVAANPTPTPKPLNPEATPTQTDRQKPKLADVLFGESPTSADTKTKSSMPKHEKPEDVAALFKLIHGRKDPSTRNKTDDPLMMLLSGGVNPNVKDRYGITPLMHAAGYGDDTALMLLINNGADVNVQGGNREMTALIGAVFKDHVICAQTLLQNGARKDIRDKDGQTAYDIALQVNGMIAKTMLADLK